MPVNNLQQEKSKNTLRSHSINLFSIKFFSTAASFLVVFFYSHKLGETAYGTYQTIWTQTYFFNAFAGLGLASLLFTYPPEKIVRLLRSIKPSSYLLLFLIPVACAGIFTYLISAKGLAAVIFFCFFLSFIFCNILEVTLMALQQFRWLPLISFLFAAAFCWLHYNAATGHYDVTLLFARIGMLLTIRLLGLLGLFFIALRKQQSAVHEDLNFDKDSVRSLWLHLYFFEASQVVLAYLDKFILSTFLDEKQFAVYFNATVSIPFLGLVFSAIANASLMRLGKEKESERQLLILHQLGKALSTVAFSCFFFFVIFSREIFTVVFSEKYLDAVPIFICTLFALPLRAFSFTALLQIRHKGKIINQGVLLDIAVSSLCFIPLYASLGLKGVALAFVVGTYAQAAFYLYHTGRLLNVKSWKLLPWRNWALKFISFGAGFSLLHYLLLSFLNEKIGLLLSLVIIIPVVLFFLLTKDLKSTA